MRRNITATIPLKAEKLSSVFDTWLVSCLLHNLCPILISGLHQGLCDRLGLVWAHCTKATVSVWAAASFSEGNKAAGVAVGMVSGKCNKSANIVTGLFSLTPGRR